MGRLEGKVKAVQSAILDVGGPKLKAAQAAVKSAMGAFGVVVVVWVYICVYVDRLNITLSQTHHTYAPTYLPIPTHAAAAEAAVEAANAAKVEASTARRALEKAKVGL